MKPGNILFDNRGRPLIADFGQARFSHDATVSFGTFFYMAPEQADTSDQRPDLRWDVYALGAIAFECLTGRPPRYTDQLHQELRRVPDLAGRLALYRKHMLESPPPREHHAAPGVRRDLARVIDHCLEVDPAKRFRDAWDIVAALDRCQQRQRARRVRNIVFPIATAAIFMIFLFAYRSTMKEIEEARAALIARTKEDFRAIALLLGKAVGPQIATGRRLINELPVANSPSEPVLGAVVDARNSIGLKEFAKKFAPLIGPAGFNGFSIADTDGKILLSVERSPKEPAKDWTIKTFDEPGVDARSFSFREWFNGVKQQPELSDGRPIVYKPLDHTHISRPYWSRTWEDKQWKRKDFGPAISAPIVYQSRTVGVIAAQLPGETLYHWMKELDMRGGFAVLLSEGCVLQSHPALGRQQQDQTSKGALLMENPDRNGHAPGEYNASCPYCSLTTPGHRPSGADSSDYRDPLNGQPYVVNYSPLRIHAGDGLDEMRNWYVVVQQERDMLFGEFEDIPTIAAPVVGPCTGNRLGVHCVTLVSLGQVVDGERPAGPTHERVPRGAWHFVARSR